MDFIYKDFNEKNYPLEPVAIDEEQWEVYDYHFSEMIDGREAFNQLEKLGFRLFSGSRRAMQFIAEHPQLIEDHPLILAGLSFQGYLPLFERPGERRFLNGHMLDSNITPRYGWLVLRRKNQ
jgi:hypothetical protein